MLLIKNIGSLFLYFGLILTVACEREHLQPSDPDEPEPLVYFIGRIGGDSIRLAGGIDSYVGSTFVTDHIENRVFSFLLSDPNHPLINSIQISLNNHQLHLGSISEDLNNTVIPGEKHYQDNHSFIPSAITVKWYDSNGIEFTTILSAQSHLFSLSHVEDVTYEGKNYKKATATFDCVLKDQNGHSLQLNNGRVVMLFGG